MADGLANRVEALDPEDENRGPPGVLTMRQRRLHAVQQQHAVGQAGRGVAQCLAQQPVAGEIAFERVAEERGHVGQEVRAGRKRRGRRAAADRQHPARLVRRRDRDVLDVVTGLERT